MDTIYALSSGPGRAAIAVIRVSGPQARTIAEGLGCKNLVPRRASLRILKHPETGTPLDQVVVLFFAKPASFTGEDGLELYVHGGRAVLRAVQDALARLGARPAIPGEFTRRAFENGKLDLTETEGLSDLIAAETEAQRAQALLLAKGGLSHHVTRWREQIIQLMAMVEADVDFVDEEDAPQLDREEFSNRVDALADDLRRALSTSQRGRKTREGFTIVIAGSPNVGKSTLLNALSGRDVAIVSEKPGTTRDSLEVYLEIAGHAVVFVDTAGLRETQDEIEAIGIDRARLRMDEADLVLWLQAMDVPTSSPMAPGPRILTVRTKSDLDPASADGLAVSAKTGEGLDHLLAQIAEELDLRSQEVEPAMVTHDRQINLLHRALEELEAVQHREPPEILAERLRRASRELAHLAGAVDIEDVLDEIFSNFCIGK